MKRCFRQTGFTVIECMISLALGSMVVLASTALLLAAQETYLIVDDNAKINDAGSYALAKLSTAIRQAGYVDYAGATLSSPPKGHPLFGSDDRSEKARSYFYTSPQVHSINGSDVLFTSFMATTADGSIDDNMRNCAGHHAWHMTQENAPGSAWNRSIFYIGRDGGGDTELYCKYQGKSGLHAADAIAHGIEAMQFLYGIDFNRDGLPDTFLNATEVNALGGTGHRDTPNGWDKVVAVRIALVVHGNWQRNVGDSAAYDRAQQPIDMFGAAYSASHAAVDRGVHYFPWQLERRENHLSRRILRSMVILRNRQTLPAVSSAAAMKR